MIAAVDTNILSDILVPNDAFAERSEAALVESAGSGLVMANEIVYAE